MNSQIKFTGTFSVFRRLLITFYGIDYQIMSNEQKKKKVSKIKNYFVLDPAKPLAGPNATIIFSKNPLPNKSLNYAIVRIDSIHR